MRRPAPVKPGQVRFAHRRDSTEPAIIHALRLAGWTVRKLDSTRGEPDLLCCKDSRVVLLEVKSAKGRLTPAQVECHAALARAGVTVHVVRSPQQALEAVEVSLSAGYTVQPVSNSPSRPRPVANVRRHR